MKKVFLVFEGADGSGKTTLAKHLSRILEVEYIHNDKSISYEDGKIKSYNYINELDSKEGCVIDRLVHTGEAVYAPIYRGYDGSDYFEDLESRMLEKYIPIIVYVYADEEVVKSRLKSRGEDYINIEDLNKIRANYDKYLSNTKFPVFRFNNSNDGELNNTIKLMESLASDEKINKFINGGI